jgi:hypothetical protein
MKKNKKILSKEFATISCLLIIFTAFVFVFPTKTKNAQADILRPQITSAPDIQILSPNDNTILNNRQITLEFAISDFLPLASSTQKSVSEFTCWYDLGGAQAGNEPGYQPDPNDPIDSNYRYLIPNCQRGVNNKIINLPDIDNDYVLNLFVRDRAGNSNFDSRWFKIKKNQTFIPDADSVDSKDVSQELKPVGAGISDIKIISSAAEKNKISEEENASAQKNLLPSVPELTSVSKESPLLSVNPLVQERNNEPIPASDPQADKPATKLISRFKKSLY